jgi:hypothetical protein
VAVRMRVLGTVELDTATGEPALHRWPRIRRLFAVLLTHAGVSGRSIGAATCCVS